MGFLDKFSGPLLSVLRIVSAVLFMQHGASKLLAFPPSPEPSPAPEAMTLIWFAGVLELVGGALLALGILTRPVAFVLSGQMAVAYWMAHAPSSPYPILNHGETAILYCFVFLYIAAAGGGPWSVEALLLKKKA